MSGQQVVSFRQMKDGTVEDYALLDRYEHQYARQLPDRILDRLRALESGLSGYKISRLTHSLQTATRAVRDGADIDWIVAALVHDLGDELAPQNHDTLAAAIIAPYVREECTWVVRHHGIFQFKYYGEKVGLDPDAREKYADEPYYAQTVWFCERWDQASFDPDYATEPLEFFEPLVREVFTRPPWDEAFIKPGEATPLQGSAA